jgi:glycine oxidase
MSSFRKVDYLIVGQGLAGSCLAIQLINQNKKIFIFDEPRKNRASAVAAGLFNPITGKMMTRTWKADELFSYLHTFYRETEKLLSTHFFHPFPLYRPFISIEEQNGWMGKSADLDMTEYIDRVFSSPTFPDEVNDPFGGLLLRSSGYLNVPLFISSVREFFLQRNAFQLKTFNEEELEFFNDHVRYQDILAEKIIFCSGLNSLQGKFFNFVPLKPLKGETMSIQIEESFERIYNRGVYIVPGQEKFQFKVGATYNTKDEKEGVTESGKIELLEKLNSLLKISYQEGKQDWGFRPTSPDRRPILGKHPAHPSLVIFNGLGTKGVSLAPYFSGQLAGWLLGISKIDRLVDVSRYY